MKKLLAIVLTVMLLAMGLGAGIANAEVLRQDTFTWMAPNSPSEDPNANGILDPGETWTGVVEIVEQMLDEEQTTAYYAAMVPPVVVVGQEAFIYTVTNVSWTPINGANGFSGFNIRNVYNVGTVGNAFGPPGWEAFAGYSGVNTPPNPANFEWDIQDGAGSGLTVSQSGDFGFTVQAGQYGDGIYYGSSPTPQDDFWMHSWLSGGQTDITDQMYISGPVPFWVYKWLDDAWQEPTGTDNIIDVGEEWFFKIGITVSNDTPYAVNNVMVKDNFGGDLRVVSVDVMGDMIGPVTPTIPAGKKPTWSGPSGVSIQWTGKTQKAHLSWNVGTLPANFSPPPQSATLFIVVATDMNTGNGNGNNLKFPNGHQEYTSEDEHCLNSGATATGEIDSDWPGLVWDRSGGICVNTGEEPPIPNNG